MAIQHCVLLSMLPPPVAVRFGLSQQLIWVFGSSFSAHRFWGGRERGVGQERGGDQERGGGKAVRAGGANKRSRKIHTTITTRGRGQRCRASPCTYDGDGFHLKAGAQSGSISSGIEDPEARVSRG
jgi:hypothetical protein